MNANRIEAAIATGEKDSIIGMEPLACRKARAYILSVNIVKTVK